MSKRKTTNILLFLILAGALLVRLWGIDFGLPDKHFGDEGHLIYWAFYSGSHLLRPPYYLYAPLVPMVLLVEFSLYFIGGYLLGVFSSTSQFFINYIIDPTYLFLIGRITMALVGVATVLLVFIVGKTFFSQRVGLFASFFLAFTFLHVKESHYIKQDILMGFFVLTSFYFALNILKNGRLRDYLLCGIMFALAFGAKYHALIILPIIFLAHFFNARSIALKKLMWFGGFFLITFSIVHPYAIIEPKSTIEQSLPLAAGSRVVYPEHLLGKPVWWWFMFEHIPQGIGHPLFFASIAGFVICLLRKKKIFFFIPLLPIVFFVTIDFFTQMHFARYAVITLPFFTLAGAIFIDYIGNEIRDERLKIVLVIVLAVMLVLPSLLRTVQFDNLLTKPDTRSTAKQWFEKTVPADSKVLVESTLRPEIPSSFNMPLDLSIKSIDKRIKYTEKLGLKASYLRSLKKANQQKTGYDITATSQVSEIMDIITSKSWTIKDVNHYVNNGVQYIVLTSWANTKMTGKFEESIEKYFSLIKEFKPTYEFKTDPHLVQVDYSTLDNVDIFRKDIIFGPIIKIYHLKPTN